MLCLQKSAVSAKKITKDGNEGRTGAIINQMYHPSTCCPSNFLRESKSKKKMQQIVPTFGRQHRILNPATYTKPCSMLHTHMHMHLHMQYQPCTYLTHPPTHPHTHHERSQLLFQIHVEFIGTWTANPLTIADPHQAAATCNGCHTSE